jgi:hypothetical protein
VFLVYGRTGWIGGKLGKLLTEQGHKWSYGRARLEDRQAVMDDMKRSKCTHVRVGAFPNPGTLFDALYGVHFCKSYHYNKVYQSPRRFAHCA